MNILEITRGVIIHQVNCKGVMGSGLALQIRKKYPKAYLRYKKHIKHAGLGRIQPIKVQEQPEVWIINMFAQNSYGTNKRHTDYIALNLCLEKVNSWTANLIPEDDEQEALNVFVPYGLGCGFGGGDWNVVKKLIKRILPNAAIIKR